MTTRIENAGDHPVYFNQGKDPATVQSQMIPPGGSVQLPVPSMVVDTGPPTPATWQNPQLVDNEKPLVVYKPETVKKIAEAISAVMSEVGHVSKGGTNEFHHYKYATMENVLQKVTPLLAKHGLAIIQSEIARSMFDQDKVVAVEYQFTIMHTSGEVWPERPKQTGMCRCRDSRGGFDDKSFNKCHTSARKYFLLALFQIPTGEEDDGDQVARIQTRPIPKATPVPMNDKIPEWDDAKRDPAYTTPHDRETGEIIEDMPQDESQVLIMLDKVLADAAESGDVAKLKSTWELDIPSVHKPALKAALEKRHKVRCNEVAADLLR